MLAAVLAAAALPPVAFAADVAAGPADASPAPAAAPAPASVLVLPFRPLADAERNAWIGRAVAESMTADLSVDRNLTVNTDKDAAVDSLAAALGAGRTAGVQFVVFGTFQKSGNEIRLTGQIADVKKGAAIAGLKATGPLTELFSLQDGLVHQVQLRLSRPANPPGAPVAGAAQRVDVPRTGANDTTDDGLLGVPRAPAKRDIGWLDARGDDTTEFAGAARDGRYRYVYTNPIDPYYYYGGYAGYYGIGYGSSYGYCYPYFPAHYPTVRVRITTSDGDGWNGRAHTQGYGMVGGGMRATQKYQPYQGSAGVQPYQVSRRVMSPGVSPAPTEARSLPVGSAAPRRSLQPSGVVTAPRAAAAPAPQQSGARAVPSNGNSPGARTNGR
jgi:TolB-like protein